MTKVGPWPHGHVADIEEDEDDVTPATRSDIYELNYSLTRAIDDATRDLGSISIRNYNDVLRSLFYILIGVVVVAVCAVASTLRLFGVI